MKFSTRVGHIAAGQAAWAIHVAGIKARGRGEDVILMSVGDPDFATPEPIVERAVEALRAGDTHYSPIVGKLPLREAIVADFVARGGPPLGPENVVVMAGAQNALFATALCLFSPGDEVLALEPVYVTYPAVVATSEARLVSVAPLPGGAFRPDLAAIGRAVTPRTRAILFANPNNPAGSVFTAEELDGIAAIARRHDLWVISDEVYAALTFDAPHRSIAALPGMAERTVTIGSLSKSQAMTGWRCGWVIGPAELVGHVDSLALCMLYGLPGFIQEAAIVALTGARGEMERMHGIYRRRRDIALAILAGVPELVVPVPQAGMFLLVDVRATGMTASDFAWSLFAETGVTVLDASAFGDSAAGFVRLTYALGDDQVVEGCRRIADFTRGILAGAKRAGSNA